MLSSEENTVISSLFRKMKKLYYPLIPGVTVIITVMLLTAFGIYFALSIPILILLFLIIFRKRY